MAPRSAVEIAWQERNREHTKEYQLARSTECRLMLAEAKSVPCLKCGKSYPPSVMDLHHRDPTQKVKTVGKMGGNPKSVRAEIAKCDVLCANCHRQYEHLVAGRTRLIYVAHPIDLAEQSDVADSMESVLLAITDCGLIGYDPVKPFVNPSAAPESVLDVNNTIIDLCSALVAVWPAGVPTVGVTLEIARAAEAGKPTAVVGGNGRSLTLQAMKGVAIFQNEREAVEWVAGELMDTDHYNAWLRQPIVYPKSAAPVAPWVPDPAFTLPTIRFVGGREPTQAHVGDAGFDLYVHGRWVLRPGETVEVDCGVNVQIPDGYWVEIKSRSSSRKRGLAVADCVIDQGYRGKLHAVCTNMTDALIEIQHGDRVAQMVPHRLDADSLRMERVDQLDLSDRGTRGYGSTGE